MSVFQGYPSQSTVQWLQRKYRGSWNIVKKDNTTGYFNYYYQTGNGKFWTESPNMTSAYQVGFTTGNGGGWYIKSENGEFASIKPDQKENPSAKTLEYNFNGSEVYDKNANWQKDPFIVKNLEMNTAESAYVFDAFNPPIKQRVQYIEKKYSKFYINDPFNQISSLSNQYNLKSINDHLNEISSVGDYSFWNCSSLISVNCPGVVSVGYYAFGKCINLRGINITDVNSIDENAFYYCKKLSGISCPNISSISRQSFYHCDSLSDVNLKNVNRIGQRAFQYCNDVRALDFPNVISVDQLAFANCQNLRSINIRTARLSSKPSDSDFRSSYIFSKCQSLKTIDLPSAYSIPAYTFSWCQSLTDISAENATVIGKGAFNRCENLSNVNCPNLRHICMHGFQFCYDLSSINIDNIEYLGVHAFCYCSALTSVTMKEISAVPKLAMRKASREWVDEPFYGCHRPVKIYIKPGMTQKFKEVSAWQALCDNNDITLIESE